MCYSDISHVTRKFSNKHAMIRTIKRKYTINVWPLKQKEILFIIVVVLIWLITNIQKKFLIK